MEYTRTLERVKNSLYKYIRLFFSFTKLQTHRVHAVALATLCRTIVKEVAEVAAALRAHYFGAAHTCGVVFYHLHCAGERVVKAWPASTRVELRVRRKEWVPARNAFVHAFALLFKKRSSKRHLRPLLTQHTVLFGRELILPLRFAVWHI